MSLGVKQQKTYLNIKEGKIYNQETAYDFLEGYLKGIDIKDREFRGEVVKYWYVNIQSQSGELYSLALSYYSGVAKSLFNSFASAIDFKKAVKIQTYQSGAFTKVVVYQNGERLNWKQSELPPIEEVTVGSKFVKDDSKRMELIVNFVKEINRII